MTEFPRITTSRGPVTSEQTAEFYLIRATAIVRACGTLGLTPYERDTADRDVLAAALAEAHGTQASDILADLDEEITMLAGAYLATYRNSGGQAAAALDTIAPGIPASPTAARSRGQTRAVKTPKARR